MNSVEDSCKVLDDHSKQNNCNNSIYAYEVPECIHPNSPTPHREMEKYFTNIKKLVFCVNSLSFYLTRISFIYTNLYILF